MRPGKDSRSSDRDGLPHLPRRDAVWAPWSASDRISERAWRARLVMQDCSRSRTDGTQSDAEEATTRNPMATSLSGASVAVGLSFCPLAGGLVVCFLEPSSFLPPCEYAVIRADNRRSAARRFLAEGHFDLEDRKGAAVRTAIFRPTVTAALAVAVLLVVYMLGVVGYFVYDHLL